jgi:hypothetical protein
VNWPDLIFDLLRVGLSEGDIARKIGSSKTAINMLKNNPTREPRWYPAMKLIALHGSYVEKGLIHDRVETAQLGEVLARWISQAGNRKPRGAIQTATRG